MDTTEVVENQTVNEGTEAEAENVYESMTDEEFNKSFESDTKDSSTEDTDTTEETEGGSETESGSDEPTVDLYREQLSNKDAKLDKPVLIKVDGVVYEMTNINELRDLAEKGTNATRKYQRLAADRKRIEALEAELRQKYGENIEQTEDGSVGEAPYDETVERIDEIAESILNSSYSDDFKNHIGQLPISEREMIGSDPAVLQGLAEDYESGIAQKIMTKVPRLIRVNGMSFLDAYKYAGSQITNKTDKKESVEKLKSQPKRTNQKSGSPVNIEDMSDDEFERYFESM